jgi:hypothetical protein
MGRGLRQQSGRCRGWAWWSLFRSLRHCPTPACTSNCRFRHSRELLSHGNLTHPDHHRPLPNSHPLDHSNDPSPSSRQSLAPDGHLPRPIHSVSYNTVTTTTDPELPTTLIAQNTASSPSPPGPPLLPRHALLLFLRGISISLGHSSHNAQHTSPRASRQRAPEVAPQASAVGVEMLPAPP